MGNKNSLVNVSGEVAGRKLTFETGKLAYQANGAVVVSYGETVILATAVMSKKPLESVDFFPLTVDYEENYWAAGKVRNSRFMKRKGRPSDESVLNSRVIDRSIRPFFPEGMRNQVQIILSTLSFDKENDPEFVALAGAMAAIAISDIPFDDALTGVKIGLNKEKLEINPKLKTEGKLDLTAVFTKDGKVAMVEAGAHEISEEKIKEALKLAQKESTKVAKLIEELQKKVGKEKTEVPLFTPSDEIKKWLDENAKEKIVKAIDSWKGKKEFDEEIRLIKEEHKEKFEETLKEDEKDKLNDFTEALDKLVKKEVRNAFIAKKKRIDGRAADEVRKLQIETGLLPRTHGSAIFARGWTQGLTTATLGAPGSELTLDGMEDEIDTKQSYIHYYSFPPYSTGECWPLRGAGRREVGHGALGEKALMPVIADKENFPYTVVMQTEIMSSDGSTSMASVCGSTLALMDAGVPLKAPVSGIAMGLIHDDKKDTYTVLTDLCALEDFAGHMDFKAAGSKNGITAIQMDIKLKGIPLKVIEDALDKAKKARMHILNEMLKVIPESKKNLSPYAPKVSSIKIPIDKIKDVIGSGGKVINGIIEKTGVEINIEDDGTVSVSSTDAEAINKALDIIESLTREIEKGEIYKGEVVNITDFGAFVKLAPNKDGLVHISKISKDRVKNVKDHLKEGQIVEVKVEEIDNLGRISLTMLFDKQKH